MTGPGDIDYGPFLFVSRVWLLDPLKRFRVAFRLDISKSNMNERVSFFLIVCLFVWFFFSSVRLFVCLFVWVFFRPSRGFFTHMETAL